MERSSTLIATILCAALPGCISIAACGAPDARPHVILISLDTTRPDRLGVYGCERATSPHLDRLAEGARVYTEAYSSSSWTLPAHASLFTGKLPSSHGARYDEEGPLSLTSALRGAHWQHYRVRGLAPGERTLAERMRAAGYATGAVVAGPWLKRPFGLDRGFDLYDDAQITRLNGRSARAVTDRSLQWLTAHRGERVFLFLNYFDPHAPYLPPSPFDRAFLAGGIASADKEDPDVRQALYDAEILYMDAEIGRLLDYLRDEGIYDESLIIATADHGELLGEHDQVGHGNSLYEPEIRIPLIVKSPSAHGPTGRDNTRVSITDVFATILHAAGLDLPPGIQASVLPKTEHPIIAEVYPLRSESKVREWRAIVDGSFKLIWNSTGTQLVDLARDPLEARDASGDHPERARALETDLRRYLASLPAPAPPGPEREVDAETQRALESLGYLESE